MHNTVNVYRPFLSTCRNRAHLQTGYIPNIEKKDEHTIAEQKENKKNTIAFSEPT